MMTSVDGRLGGRFKPAPETLIIRSAIGCGTLLLDSANGTRMGLGDLKSNIIWIDRKIEHDQWRWRWIYSRTRYNFRYLNKDEGTEAKEPLVKSLRIMCVPKVWKIEFIGGSHLLSCAPRKPFDP